MKELKNNLQQRKTDHLYRHRRVSETPQQPEMIIDDQQIISFCSNDYLGLANHPEVKQAFIKGAEHYGVGSGAAHLVNGHTAAHHSLEEELAEFTGYPRTLLFSTGYMANLGLVQALVSKGDSVLEDRLNHASLLDAGLLSGARLIRYQHNDPAHLEHKLASRETGEKLVLSDGVFSMDGDIANLPGLINSCAKHDASLMIDDAHGFGVLGQHGKGTLEYFDQTPEEVPIYMATLGKALGCSGAFIAGSEDLVETLIQQARSYIYTTAMPAAIAEATRTSLRIIQRDNNLRDQLKSNIKYFRQGCEQRQLPLAESETAIQPLLIGENEDAVKASQVLLRMGLLITAIRPPTVPAGTSRLRITLSASHQEHHIDKLLDALTYYFSNDHEQYNIIEKI